VSITDTVRRTRHVRGVRVAVDRHGLRAAARPDRAVTLFVRVLMTHTFGPEVSST